MYTFIRCRILDLQKDRYFEMLASKYWNQSQKAQCLNSDDNEGITLESLGELSVGLCESEYNFEIENFAARFRNVEYSRLN